MRCGSILLALALLISPVLAAQRPAAYFIAENVFNSSYNLPQRVTAQVLLIAAGHQIAVPSERFTLNTFNATRDFQLGNNLPPSGGIDGRTWDRLLANARPLFKMWDFREITHPIRGRALWMPQGMGLNAYPNKYGVRFRDPAERFNVAYNYLPNTTPAQNYEALLDKMRSNGTDIHYAVMKDDWFVISATTPSGDDEYVRYHADGDGILGFAAFWNNAKGVVWGERVAILMSSSLAAVMLNRPAIDLSGFADAPPVVAQAPFVLPKTPPVWTPTFSAPERPKRQPPIRPATYTDLPQPKPAQTRPRPAPKSPDTAMLVSPSPAPAPVIDLAKPVVPLPDALTNLSIKSHLAEKRVALVIGNSEYRHAPEIPNPAHDAEDIAGVLKALGFDVVEGRNLDFQATRTAIREFSDKLADADLGLLFYAGHGVQVSGTNYLIPIDAQLDSVAALEVDAINLDSVLRAMETQPRTNIVILDACRDNPFTRTLKRSASSSRSSDVGQGLAPIRTEGGTLVAFATDPGNVALDGAGTRNSPFTGALLQHMTTPELEIETLLKRVRRDVIAVTKGRQTPWSNSSLVNEVYLASVKH